ncbi:MAG: mannonate dehydratase [Rhodobacteraceae bacterium]|nr:mannonate dehydratase [Paracoccaceae bacterium]
MEQTWRWFGPDDKVSLADIRQAGANGIVTALRHSPSGVPRTAADIEARQLQITTESDGALRWSVVEGLPVSEEIERHGADIAADTGTQRTSLVALAAAELRVICCHFMPVLDRTRSDLRAAQALGGRAMWFDRIRLALFGLHIPRRSVASGDCGTGEDDAALPDAVESPSVGETFCTGLPGERPDKDRAAIARRFGPGVRFVHLGNMTRDSDMEPYTFSEDAHLVGQTDKVSAFAALLEDEAIRRTDGRADAEIPMRPRHGQALSSDLTAGAPPGYPAAGLRRGWAELCGVIAEHMARPQSHAA